MKHRLIVSLSASFLLMGMIASQAPTSHAASAVHYVRGYSIQGGWLCYGWTRPAYYHCTRHWRRVNGHAVSLVPHFVPNHRGGVSTVVGTGGTPGASGGTTTSATATSGQPCHGTVTFPARISQWTVPAGCYGRIFRPNPQNYVRRPSYGYCNWWPEVLHPAFSGSLALHQSSHRTARVGAVVFFAGGVQGASREGHYAQVVSVAPGGYWLLITEMNFSWRGGGFARVDYRFIHTGAGVSFRY